MTTVLGVDWATRIAARYGTKLRDVSFVRRVVSGPNPSDPSGPPLGSDATYNAKGMAFAFGQRLVDGTSVRKGEFQVIILLGTIELAADDAEAATLDLSLETAHVDTVLRAKTAGDTGNDVTVDIVADGSTQEGTLVEHGTNVRISYLPGSTTVADIEALVTARSELVEVMTAGTGATVLDSTDQLAATPLSGGLDATGSPAPDAVPEVDDLLTCQPPNKTATVTGSVVSIVCITPAFVTVQVRGAAP